MNRIEEEKPEKKGRGEQMSLRARWVGPVPEETERVARAAFPKGNIYMRMRDELGTIYVDEQFEGLFPERGQPGESPWRLALITVMQFAEGLTDRQAADAVRGRLDWKYALGLELTDAGFDFSVLSEFRSRLVEGQAEQVLLDSMLSQFKARGLLKARGKQRTDSTHIVAAIGTLNRVELVAETLRHALESLAVVVPEWLKAQVGSEWFERYGERMRDYRLPKEEPERQAMAETIGRDGVQLLSAIYDDSTPDWLRRIPAVDVLRQVWVQQYYQQEGHVHWRLSGNLPPSGCMIPSPYDTQARYSTKRETSWVGYKAHLTETCDEDSPNLITHVDTTLATDSDISVMDCLYRDLAHKALLPAEHLVDTAYVGSDWLVTSSTDYGVDLLGPVHPDTTWQAQAAQGFDIAHFTIDWSQHCATCPMDKTSTQWTPHRGRNGNPVIKIQFSPSVCLSCSARPLCTRSKTGGRNLSVLPENQHLALQAARQHQQTQDFKDRYALRAGVEGTISQSAFALQSRRARYRGLAKVHLQNIATSAAINLTRIVAWLFGSPRSCTCQSHFAALAV
jgi:transposase